ncbi:hypothetical protein SO694_00017252 [Aureococcus anophagefferens]|uniref:Uncharacterized protein n=1 Tax=Aureococcus anophagefferens TaxID=44056 RepID=A0ABR1G2G3_AURAN
MFASFLASATTAWALVSVRTPRAPRRLVARDAALDLAASEELFASYYDQAPEPQRSTYAKAWSIVEATFAAAGGDAMALDASAFGGALASFTTPGPSEAQLEAMPAEAAAIMRKLSDTAASYYRVTSPDLDWGTCYRTLNREVGARLWPSARTDVPNLTLYFGSGSPANPDELFMRLECVPRRDVAVDAAYAEAYYAPFTSTCLELMTGDDRFRPYVSDSPYARGCLAPSGVRVFFDGADQCADGDALARAEAAALELGGLWRDQLAAAAPLDAEASAAMAARDAKIRRVAADSSPDNANRALVYGDDLFAQTKDLLAGAAGAL